MLFGDKQEEEIRLGIIADDLSGGMDTGLQFAKRGASTILALRATDLAEAEVLVISTESRDVSPEHSVKLIENAARLMHGRTVYKKVDSTFRGNIGPEIKALLKATNRERAIITPAFPEQGRVVVEGELFIDGRPFHRTPYARNLAWPISNASIVELLARQSGSFCTYVERQKVERGPWGLVRALESQVAQLTVVDAITREHLDIIAEAIVLSEGRWLPCGSAGLAGSWAKLLTPERPISAPRPVENSLPALIVSGSHQKATASQVRQVKDKRKLPVVPFFTSGGLQDPDLVVARAQEHLSIGQSVILSSAGEAFIRDVQGQVAMALGQVAAALCAKCEIAGLVLTGGAVALAVCDALDTAAIRIVSEVEPGVPAGVLQGGLADGKWVITKAGGFGSPDVFVKAMDYLQGRRS